MFRTSLPAVEFGNVGTIEIFMCSKSLFDLIIGAHWPGGGPPAPGFSPFPGWISALREACVWRGPHSGRCAVSNHTEITTESQHVTALKDALDRNDRVRARNHAEALVRLRPDLARSHFNLGVILLQARDWEKAHTAFACALRIEPGHEKARLGLLAARKALRPAESQGSPKAGGPPAQVTPISIASPASAVPPGEARSPSRFPQPQTALPSAVRPPNVPPAAGTAFAPIAACSPR